MDNPLAANPPPPQQQPQQPDPMQQYAQKWAMMQQQSPEDLAKYTGFMDYALPIIGALAGNPKVTPKQVIKAVSGMVADEKIAPSDGVAIISQMPADQDKLYPWLRQMYSDELMSTVHAKAALMRGEG